MLRCLYVQTWPGIYFHFLYLFSVSLEKRKFGASIMILLWPEKIKWFCIWKARIEHICNVSQLHANHFILQFATCLACCGASIIKTSSILVGCFLLVHRNEQFVDEARIWLMMCRVKCVYCTMTAIQLVFMIIDHLSKIENNWEIFIIIGSIHMNPSGICIDVIHINANTDERFR